MFNLKHIVHRYQGKTVLDIPLFESQEQAQWLVLGPSGSGKSTLIQIMAGLLKPDQGSVSVAGRDLYTLKESVRDQFRGKNIGIVFQQMHLLPTLTVTQNLQIARYLAGLPAAPGEIDRILNSLDLGHRATAYPHQLSQGQKQRVGIARAVINNPKLILADEPTSSLDDSRCEQVIHLLMEKAQACEATLVVTTHDQRIKSRFTDRLVLDEMHSQSQPSIPQISP